MTQKGKPRNLCCWALQKRAVLLLCPLGQGCLAESPPAAMFAAQHVACTCPAVRLSVNMYVRCLLISMVDTVLQHCTEHTDL